MTVAKIRWDKQDTLVLKKYHQAPINVLLKKFPERTENSIRTKIHYLGLKRVENINSVRTERLFILK